MILRRLLIQKEIAKTVLLLLSFVLSCLSRAHVLDDTPLIDTHNDLAYNIYKHAKNNLSKYDFEKDLSSDVVWGFNNCPSCHTDLPRLKAGKVAAQFWAAYVDCDTQYKDAVAITLEQIDVIKRLVKKYPEHLQFAESSHDILDAFAKKKIASLIGIEGGHSIDSRLSVLRVYYELGVRYMTLTHACNTPWADNSYVDDSKPVHNLTDFGKIVVQEMNRLGMMVDLSHVSYNVMDQAIDISKAPVIFSHSSAYSIRKHNRNVKDSILHKLKQNEGVIMVTFVPEFINSSPEKDIIDVVKHINHIVDTAGITSVGIGGDFSGFTDKTKGLEDVSKYPNLFDRLQKENATRWTDNNLKLLAGDNLLRVFRKVEKVRDSLKDMVPIQDWILVEDLNTVAIYNQNLWTCRTINNGNMAF